MHVHVNSQSLGPASDSNIACAQHTRNHTDRSGFLVLLCVPLCQDTNIYNDALTSTTTKAGTGERVKRAATSVFVQT